MLQLFDFCLGLLSVALPCAALAFLTRNCPSGLEPEAELEREKDR